MAKDKLEHLTGLVEEMVQDNTSLFDVLNRVRAEQEQTRASLLQEISLMRDAFDGAASFRVLREMCRELNPTLAAMQSLIDQGDFSDPEIIRGHVTSLVISMNAILQRMGAEKISVNLGVDAFDPNLHLCVRLLSPAESPFPLAPARTVVRVIEDGYTAAGKVIIPAKVDVQTGAQPAISFDQGGFDGTLS